MAAPKPANPFQPYPGDHGPIKVFLFGEPGTMKTRRALSLPGPLAIIDLEGGACDYQDLADAQRGDIYLSTKSVAKVEEALGYLESLPAGAIGTVIIDPVTIIWQQLQQGHIERILRRGYIMRSQERGPKLKVEITDPEEVTFELADWNKLKKRYGDILTRFMNLPSHGVLIARGGEKNDQNGKPKGFGFEAEKTTPFVVKTVIETHANGTDRVLKDRTGVFREGGSGPRIDLRDLLRNAGPSTRRQETDTEAAGADAEAERKSEHHASWDAEKGAFFIVLRDLGLKGKNALDQVGEWCEVLDRPRPSTMDSAQRAGLVTYLKSEKGRASLFGYLKIPLDAHEPAPNK
jgi:hypothetical protein